MNEFPLSLASAGWQSIRSERSAFGPLAVNHIGARSLRCALETPSVVDVTPLEPWVAHQDMELAQGDNSYKRDPVQQGQLKFTNQISSDRTSHGGRDLFGFPL